MKLLSRSERSLVTDWWFTVDRVLVAAILMLFAVGVVVSLAASPSAAMQQNLPAFRFVERHLVFAAIGVAIMLAISLASPAQVRRLALVLLVGGLIAMVAVLIAGPEINGARRWLRLGGFSLQPSELVKPAFVVIAGWLMGERFSTGRWTGLWLSAALFAVVAVLLRMQPDFGQLMLLSVVWCGMLVLAGAPLIWPAALVATGAAVLATAYLTHDYVRGRIDAFLSGDQVAGAQTERAMSSFVEGGFFGRGPGAGSIKIDLPDAHTDFILAVIAEEYGVVTCLALLTLFAFVVLRMMARAIVQDDAPVRIGLVGLAILFAGQTLFNAAVNVGLLPAKGITLPLISYGGTSIVAISVTLGMALALARRRPGAQRLKPVSFAITPAGAGELTDGSAAALAREAGRGQR